MPSVTDIASVPTAPDTRSLKPVVATSNGQTSAVTRGSQLPVSGQGSPPEAATDPARQGEPSNQEAVRETVHNLNDYVQSQQRELLFEVDDVTGDTVIKVRDSKTDEVIRQIPSEELMALARRMLQMSEDKGNLFQDKV